MRSRHNQKYWACEGVFGFGLGAASFVDGVRTTRPATMLAYTAFVDALAGGDMEAATAAAVGGGTDEGTYEGAPPPSISSTASDVSDVPDLLEVVMLALRTRYNTTVLRCFDVER